MITPLPPLRPPLGKPKSYKIPTEKFAPPPAASPKPEKKPDPESHTAEPAPAKPSGKPIEDRPVTEYFCRFCDRRIRSRISPASVMTARDPDVSPFRELCRREPRLATLERDVQAVKDTGGPWFCANDHWYGSFKPRLVRLVGFGADEPELRTTEAYDVAYGALYEQLPDCRNCRCVRIDRALGLKRTSLERSSTRHLRLRSGVPAADIQHSSSDDMPAARKIKGKPQLTSRPGQLRGKASFSLAPAELDEITLIDEPDHHCKLCGAPAEQVGLWVPYSSFAEHLSCADEGIAFYACNRCARLPGLVARVKQAFLDDFDRTLP
jgi:hypothetical protein